MCSEQMQPQSGKKLKLRASEKKLLCDTYVNTESTAGKNNNYDSESDFSQDEKIAVG
jgi:hypothetical protein